VSKSFKRNWALINLWGDVISDQTRDKVWHNFWLTIKDNHNTDILYFAAQESTHCLEIIYSGWKDSVYQAWEDGPLPDEMMISLAQDWFLNKIKKTLDQNNNRLYCIVGRSVDFRKPEICHPAQSHSVRYDNMNWNDRIFTEIVHWDTYWLARHTARYAEHFMYPIMYYGRAGEPVKHLFVCKNGKKHPHRFYFMNLLAKYDLIDHNVVTWNGPKYADPDNHWTESDYERQTGEYWTEQILALPEYDANDILQTDDIIQYDGNFTHTEPEGYFQALLDVVTESSVAEIFITEKTLKPLLTEKPFVCIAAQGHHRALKNMGFELYTDVFDYSFDQMPNWESRCEAVATQLYYLNQNLTTRNDRKLIWQRTRERARRNLIRLCEILKDRRGFPVEIINRYLLCCKDEHDAVYRANQMSLDAADQAAQILDRIRQS